MQNWNIYLINHLVCEMSENMLMKYIKLMMFSEILVNAYCDLRKMYNKYHNQLHFFFFFFDISNMMLFPVRVRGEEASSCPGDTGGSWTELRGKWYFWGEEHKLVQQKFMKI